MVSRREQSSSSRVVEIVGVWRQGTRRVWASGVVEMSSRTMEMVKGDRVLLLTKKQMWSSGLKG
jgi:molybdenum cofactor biosynthesis enzyme